MQQKKLKITDNQILYLGRWVDKDTFTAFVYNEKEQRLARNYKEYKQLIESGLWFPEKPVGEIPEVKIKPITPIDLRSKAVRRRKKSHGANS